jgi:hypothetical protein
MGRGRVARHSLAGWGFRRSRLASVEPIWNTYKEYYQKFVHPNFSLPKTALEPPKDPAD